ncbi:hypothetical protein GCM10023149_45580 [Mucilaginibacter gynuensis]|uniref:DUF4349 domain-containing protein n=2 Tax=Mucilaginibacter gynuensis TaxID=1302236 RepID=A0ABP8HAL5_9SPHI
MPLILTLGACGNEKKTNAAEAEIVLQKEAGNSAKRFVPPVVVPDNGESADDISSEESASDAAKPMAGNTSTASNTDKKIIKEGVIRFETGNVADTRKEILASLKKMGGYVDNDSETTDGDENRKEYTLDIRIPAANFDGFVSNVSATAVKIDSRSIRATDVTTQYIDNKTRLDNKKLLEARYLDLLKKATKISDLLEIENKLTEIRSDIESTQSQLNYLNKQVAYSSLSITFYTKQAEQVASGNGFVYKLQKALGNGVGTIESILFGIIALWPLWLAVVIVYWLIRRWAKRNTLKE